MSQRKMLQLSTGALLFLLPWFGGLVVGKISKEFSDCLDFFYKKTPPQGITGGRYKQICQFYKKEFRFATLYDLEHRTPLYSAYILSSEGDAGSTRSRIWKYEPQLAFPSDGDEMQDFKRDVPPKIRDSQAVKKDYRCFDCTKGHLNPRGHHTTEEDREATYTLTNIVPQKEGSNSATWNVQEAKFKKTSCKGTMYMITGVMPYEPARLMNDRVSIPEYMWSAYCCQPDEKSEMPHTKTAVGANYKMSEETVAPLFKSAKDYDVKEMSLKDLEDLLKQRLKMSALSLFDGHCQ